MSTLAIFVCIRWLVNLYESAQNYQLLIGLHYLYSGYPFPG